MIKILLDFQPLLPTTSHVVLENQGEKFCCGCGFEKNVDKGQATIYRMT